MESLAFDKCLETLKTSESDNERLAALMIVTKVMKAEDCDVQTRRKIFDAIGFQFVTRLLKTVKTPDGCPKNAYRSTAVTVLSSFCSLPEYPQGLVVDVIATRQGPLLSSQLNVSKDTQQHWTTRNSEERNTVVHKDMLALLPYFNDIITSGPSEPEDLLDAHMVDDSYECLTCLATQAAGLDAIVSSVTVPALCRAYCQNCYGCEKALQLLLYLVSTGGSHCWGEDLTVVEELLQKLTHIFRENQDEKKFEMCETLCRILVAVNKGQAVSFTSKGWQDDLHAALFRIIRSKQSEDRREVALRLASVMVDLLGAQWALGEDEESCKFLLIFVHLACVEVRMTLEDQDFTKIESKASLLSSCYSLLENIISYMTAGPSLCLNERQVKQLHSAMVGAFNAVIFYLNKCEGEFQDKKWHPVTIASIRALGAWIAEETTALKEDVVKLLPFLVSASARTFHKAQQQCEASKMAAVELSREENTEKQYCTCPKESQAIDSEAAIRIGNGVANLDMADKECDRETKTDAAIGVAQNGVDSMKRLRCDAGLGEKDGEVSGTEMGNEAENEMGDGSVCPQCSKVRRETQVSEAEDETKMEMEKEKGKGETRVCTADAFMVPDMEVLRFLLPGLCHLSAESSARRQLNLEGAYPLLVDYFMYQWGRFTAVRLREAEIALITLCGVFLNYTVMDHEELVRQSVSVKLLLDLVLTQLPHLVSAGREDDLVLCFNMAVVGLMTLRHKKQFGCPEAKLQSFFGSCVSLLKAAHARSTVGEAEASFALGVADKYAASWHQVSELWFLGMQALSYYIPKVSWLCAEILKSSWLPQTCKLLLDIEENNMDTETAVAYHTLLCEMSRTDQQARQTVLDAGGLAVAKMYQMDKLASTLVGGK